MSRIGKLPVTAPKGVDVKVDGRTVTIKGPKGTLTNSFNDQLVVEVKDGVIVVKRSSDEKNVRALHGLTRALINNMVIGVTQGYQKTLEIVGVGYRAQQTGKNVSLQVGYSRPIEVIPPAGVELKVEGQNRIHVTGPDKQAVGLWAAKIRRIRPPDLYKGKGIRYAREQVHLKPGKGGKKGA